MSSHDSDAGTYEVVQIFIWADACKVSIKSPQIGGLWYRLPSLHTLLFIAAEVFPVMVKRAALLGIVLLIKPRGLEKLELTKVLQALSHAWM